jgi:hypothetical protein
MVVIHNHLKGFLRVLWQIFLVSVLLFLTYQTHRIFIDHREEYPWQTKNIMDLSVWQNKLYDKRHVREEERKYFTLTTKEFNIEQKLPLFGFPHKRYWNEINGFVNAQNRQNDETLGYMSNEVKTISEWYMDTRYQADDDYYLVGIKRPLSFVDDYKFPQIGGKETVYEIENEYGETVVRIYLVSEND